MSDVDGPRLAVYVALGLIVCFLGARYLRSQVTSSGGGDAAVATRSEPAQPGDGGASGISVERAGGGRLTVHVAGAVRRPGVYTLPPGARVNDALRRAGGAVGRADLTAVNLAAKLEDGRQVLVPLKAVAMGGGAAGAGGPAGGADGAGGGGAAGAGGGGVAGAGGARAGGSGAGGTAPAGVRQPINLNTATLEQLDTLDGVGPGIAQRILDYRQQHGGFRNVQELAEVPGIGAKRLAALSPMVTV